MSLLAFGVFLEGVPIHLQCPDPPRLTVSHVKRANAKTLLITFPFVIRLEKRLRCAVLNSKVELSKWNKIVEKEKTHSKIIFHELRFVRL